MRAQKFAKTIGELSNLNATKCHLMQYKRAKDKGEKKRKKKKKKKKGKRKEKIKEHEHKANKHKIY